MNFRSWIKNAQFGLQLDEEAECVISLMQPDARYHVHRGPRWNKYSNAVGFIVAQFDWQQDG